jgi:transposase InsO family protein
MSRGPSLLIGAEALFRFRIVSAVRALELGGLGRSAAVRAVAGARHLDEQGKHDSTRKVSERTLYRWLGDHETGGLAGLEPAQRPRIEGSLVLDDELLRFLTEERKADRDASIPELLRRAEQHGIVADASAIDRTSVWRAMRRTGVDTRRRKQPNDADMRRFRYPERMQMVLLDFKHFRAGIQCVKRVAIYMLDDATRYGLGVLVATTECADAVLRLLHATIGRFGLMTLLYWDGGSGFKDGDVLRVVAKLEVHPIAGTAGYPEGHGGIERFNRSLKARELRTYRGAAHIEPDCGALTLRLQHDLEIYNHLPHEALDMETPHQRWTQCRRALRPAPSDDWMRDCFTLQLERRVSKDHIVPVGSTSYEVPRGHRGEWVTLHRRLLEQTPDEDALYFEHDGRLVRLHPVDLAFNATSGRARPQAAADPPAPVPAKSASTLSFERTYGSILAPDGGFSDNDDDDEQED